LSGKHKLLSIISIWRFTVKKFLCLALLFSLNLKAQEVTPTERVYQSLDFVDDIDFANIDLVIDRQLAAYRRMGLRGTIRFGTKEYPRTVLQESLESLRALAHQFKHCQVKTPKVQCQQQFNQQMNRLFAIYRPVPAAGELGHGRQQTHFTSYYSPDISGSRVPTERFKNVIYRLPTDPADRNFSRVEIDFHGALKGKGLELFYVEDSLYDLYLLHVQGGGRIRIHNPDGTQEIKYLSFEGRNTRAFQMIWRYMLEKGYLQPGQTGIPQQRQFLDENPHLQEEIFASSPSYIFFRESDDEPVGVHSIPLTELRSVAIDSRIYKSMGLITFVKTIRATHISPKGQVVKIPFSRFFIAQDTGGAIRGNARCDLYFGYGDLAELTAYNMNELGEQYFLVKK
jgi:membrane-bound lytic murein transglycosylase A